MQDRDSKALIELAAQGDANAIQELKNRGLWGYVQPIISEPTKEIISIAIEPNPEDDKTRNRQVSGAVSIEAKALTEAVNSSSQASRDSSVQIANLMASAISQLNESVQRANCSEDLARIAKGQDDLNKSINKLADSIANSKADMSPISGALGGLADSIKAINQDVVVEFNPDIQPPTVINNNQRQQYTFKINRDSQGLISEVSATPKTETIQ